MQNPEKPDRKAGPDANAVNPLPDKHLLLVPGKIRNGIGWHLAVRTKCQWIEKRKMGSWPGLLRGWIPSRAKAGRG